VGMQKKQAAKSDGDRGKYRAIVTLGVLGAIIIIVFVAMSITRPERSVEAFCRIYAEENAKLPKPDQSQEAFGVAGLVSSSQEPRLFADVFSKLERVAPEDIRQDAEALKRVFEEIDKDPSKSLGAGLSGLSAISASYTF
jgi:hypothetical protein